MALQAAGESTCTLGEVKNRADLVVFWGSDPLTSHPRHLERYSADPAGEFVPDGRAGRTLVVADVRLTATSAAADLFLPVEPGRDFEVLWTHRAVEALLRLVTDLNDYTRFYARRMRVSGDVAGADSVLAWQSGYPFAVNLARGYPRYNPGEFSAQDMILRGEVDACLLVGSQGVRRFVPETVRRLQGIPTVALDGPLAEPAFAADVRFTTAVYGIHLPGTAYRMDEVPVPLRAFLRTDYPSDAEVLEQIRRRVT
jgi:formylmethanofuran dehydrogenase subunit B